MADKIRSFRDLKVYQFSFSLQQEIFEKSKYFPKEELFSLTDQIRRSSRSIGANQAEAWHKRRYRAHFVSKLTDSDGEQAETQHWLDTALECKYISVVFPPSCRFYPSCSEYSKQAFEKYNFFKAFFLSIYRILRCNPWNDGGYDPLK